MPNYRTTVSRVYTFHIQADCMADAEELIRQTDPAEMEDFAITVDLCDDFQHELMDGDVEPRFVDEHWK